VLLPMLNQGELAVAWSFLFLYFSVAGAGAWALDNVIGAGASRRLNEPATDDSLPTYFISHGGGPGRGWTGASAASSTSSRLPSARSRARWAQSPGRC
jgi:hypothetical protein